MAITVKHKFVSAIPDAGDPTIVQPSNWNDDHQLTGTVPVANGGTGASTANDGFNALAPSQTGNSGKYLTTDGSNTSWATNPLGTVTSVGLSAPSIFTVSGSPVTSSGTLALTYSGTALPVANGGTGVTSSSGANSVVLRDSNGNITTNCLFEGYVTQAASGTAIVLIASSAQNYQITGSGGQTIRLPDATTLPNGATFTFNNNQSSGTIVVQNNSSTTVATINSGGYVTVVLLSNSIAAGSWDRHDSTPANVSWSTNTLDYAGSITSATWNGNTVSVNRGGTGATTLTGYVKGNGTSALTANATIPTTDLSGTITNAQLANSAITINGTSTSLGGSVSVGTVTSVAATAGTGISVTGSPITSSGTLTITNTAPDQTVAITSGTGISVTGTYPNFTVTNTSPSSGGTVTSVAATVPSFLSVTGSPITSSGTLAIAYSGTALPVLNGGTGTTTSTGTGSVVLATRPTMSVTGTGFTLQDATDNTKQANFNLSGITTGNTNSYLLPNISGASLASLGAFSQTFQGQQAFTPTLSTYTFTVGSATMTGTITLGQSTTNQTVNIQAGATASGATKAINIGSGGLSGSTTNITIGGTAGTSTTTLNGTVTLANALAVGSGGTGQTTANAAFNALAPSQTSNSGKYLTTDGTNTSWGSLGNAYSRTSFTATANQTTFTVSYTVGYVEVYVNGTLLNAADYTASNGTSVVLAVGRATGDIVETIAFATGTVTPTNLSVGTSLVQGGTNGYVLYNNSGVVGNLATTGSGSVVRGTSPTIATPTITSLYGQNSNLVSSPYSDSGLIPAELIYRLNSTVAGADSTAVQKILGVGVTVSASTVYQFELVYTLNKSVGAVSHAMQLSFGGTATLNNISYDILAAQSSAAGTINGGVTTSAFFMVIQQATATTINSATTNTTSAFYGIVKGTVSINAGGTFIPQYTLTAAPGGAYTTQIGSYFKLSPMSASGANTSIGTWA